MLYPSYLIAFSLIFISTITLIGADSTLLDQSFSLSTILTIYLQDGKHYRYGIDESYSATQRRARIRYQTVGQMMPSQAAKALPREGTFYVTENDVVLINETNRECVQSDAQTLRSLFDFLPQDLGDQRQTTIDVSYVLGPARILYLIDERRNQMTRSTIDSGEFTERRNVPSVMYKLIYATNQGNIQLTIFYSKETTTTTTSKGNNTAGTWDNHPQSVPLEVILENGNILVLYSFMNPIGFSDEINFNSQLDSGSMDATVELDLFTIEPSLGCGKLVDASSHPGEILHLPGFGDQQEEEELSFSFRARLEANDDHAYDYTTDYVTDEFVAYDGLLSSLRVDKFSNGRSLTTLSNFYLGKTYSIVERQPDEDWDPVFGNILNLAQDNNGNTNSNNDGQQQMLSCVVIEAQSSQNNLKFTLGELLLGADRFRYLGRGRVRGIQALVYEAHDVMWPVWVRQPSIYYRGNLGQTQPGINVRANNKNVDYILNTVVYFSVDSDQSAPKDENNRPSGGQLLQIDVNRLRRENGRYYLIERITRQVYDFEWDLKSHGPLGQPIEEYFSPVDMCPASEEDGNHYGRVEMLSEALLGRDDPKAAGSSRRRPDELSPSASLAGQLSWLSVSKRRNLAYLRALQYTLPITMVHDLETRLSSDPNNNDNNSNAPHIRLMSSFRFTEHDRRVARLTLLGDGVPRVMFKRDLHTSWMSFGGCALVAAHRKVNTYFAYLAKSETCVVDTRPDNGGAQLDYGTSSPEMPFQLQTNGSYEIFKVAHELDTHLPVYDSATSLAHGRKRLDYFRNKEKSTLVLVDNHRHLRGHQEKGANATTTTTTGKNQVTFRIESLKVTEENEKDWYRIDNSSLPDTNKFIGFGLVETDTRYNRRLVSLDDDVSWSRRHQEGALEHGLQFNQLTFAQCQAACLADSSCRSYSFCIRRNEVECILSTVGFRDAVLVLQLMGVAPASSSSNDNNNNTKTTKTSSSKAPQATLTLNIDETNRIQVKKHPNCELHNKNYLALFGPADRQRRPLANRRIYGVTGREQCAQMCFDHVLELISDDLKSSRASISLMNDPASDPAALEAALRSHRASASTLIRAMLYFDAAYLETLPEETRRLVERVHMLEANPNGSTDGYCVLGDRMTAHERQHFERLGRPLVEGQDDALEAIGMTSFQVERYAFKFESFYERQPDVELRASPERGEEKSAYQRVVTRSVEASRSDYELMRSFIERGDNKQSLVQTLNLESNCAYRCFVQWSEVWPPCKSFDLILSTSGRNEMALCQMNSITLRQAIRQERFDLIEDKPDRSYKVWHFDPTPGLVLDEVDQDGRFRLVEVAAELGRRDRARRQTRLAPGVLLLCSLVALVGGVACGLWVGSRYIVWVASGGGGGGGGQQVGARDEHGDTNQLVERQTVEFSNLVNFQGKIE